MISISKNEREILLQRFPDLSFVCTVHKCYIPEKPTVMRYLNRLRFPAIAETPPQRRTATFDR